MMKVLPVAALTASAICVISASLKFGVIRCCACWAGCEGWRRRSDGLCGRKRSRAEERERCACEEAKTVH